MTTRSEPMSTPFQPVPALPRHFQDAHFTAFSLRRSRPLPLPPSLWSRLGRVLTGIGLQLFPALCDLRSVA